MTDLIVPRGDTFPRSFLDTYRANKNEPLYNELTSSKSDELVLQNSMSIPVSEEIHHGRSENLLDVTTGSASSTEYLDKQEIALPKTHRRIPVYDRVDPEDSIRDIVTENDFYRFVLFKKHYDKYLHLSQKYEEARNIAYYLEEKYHEVKTERDDLIKQRDQLTRKLESNESLLREKEDEVFLQFERVVYLEEQCDKIRAEKEKCEEKKELIVKERDKALRMLHVQANESEYNRRKLEKARQEVVTHMTRIKNEKDTLERENDQLKEELEAERRGLGKYLIRGRQLNDDLYCMEKQVEDLKLMEHSNSALASQFQKAVQHLATCRLKKCSVCAYTKTTYRKMSPNGRKYDRKLFGCLQAPFLEMRNMIKPPPSPIHGEGESLSEWFCHMDGTPQSDCSSLSVPFAELSISYMDDVSDTSSYGRDDEKDDQERLSRGNCSSFRRFGSDSGFSSDICADYKSNATTPKEKFCPNAVLDEADCAKLTRTKWTASFRKLIRRIKK
ncbi:unnamed protein product [Psylliodes chrysocephalus]|uniref:Uncharacterized protein n=1 Tax=Psylliodes chrysocephalus TaxID=3402493 RepID=A0A9P0GDE3_9CUCU|nr:unnamed protein product [Psylliodes chrysocephala]